jgi:hypothetical protein
MTCDENLNISKSTSFNIDSKCDGRRESLPMRHDGSIDYDGNRILHSLVHLRYLNV